MSKLFWLGLVAVCAFALAGCGGAPGCLDSQPYMQAKTFPPLKSPAGLDVPKPDPEMRIPDVSGGPVGHYAKAPDGTDAGDPAARCLTTPPPMTRG